MKNILVWLIISSFTLIISNPTYSAGWYEGGNLHGATVKTWKQSSYRNRLATAADWFVSITKSHNPKLKRKLDRLPTSQYLSTLKKFSAQLEKCVSDTVNIESKGRGFAKPSSKIAEFASICYVSMYGVK